jgi:hypothetical protein
MMATRIATAGFHLLPAADYHADPAPEPSLSHSILRLLLDKSPRHAHYAHPRLTPEPLPDSPTTAKDEGTVLHHLMLSGGNPPVIVPADSWRTAAAKDARDKARAAGRVPVLADDYAALCRCAKDVLEQMREDTACAEFFAPGRSEVTMVWQEGTVWCRGLVDRLPDDPAAPFFDLKSTGLSAAPAQWEWSMRREYATSAAFYVRGAVALGRQSREVRYITFERSAPFGISINAPGSSLYEEATLNVRRGLLIWARCMLTGKWPGYPRGVHYIETMVTAAIRSEVERQEQEAADTVYSSPLDSAA